MNSGVLYIVATPIGNLADISFRAIDTLKKVDKILCEDTRHSKHLLQHYAIQKPLVAVHEHNETTITTRILAELESGVNFAFISDAGTPLISDPGFVLVRQAKASGVDVVPIPGACAVVAALSAAGIATDRFCFQGFLPAKQVGRINKLKIYATEGYTSIFYESTHRILASLADFLAVVPRRQLVLAKELTKTNEAIITGTAQELIDWLNQDIKRCKGEFVVIMTGATKQVNLEKAEVDVLALLQKLCETMSSKSAAKLAADITGLKKNALYKMILEEK